MNGILFHGLAVIAVTAFIVLTHEMLHWLPARLFRFAPTINMHPLWRPHVSYENKGQYGKIFVTTILPAAVLVICGLLLPSEGHVVIVYAKILCLSNIVNIFPFTADGQVLVVCVSRWVERCYCQRSRRYD